MRLDQLATSFLRDDGDYRGLDHWRDAAYDGPCELIDADKTEALADAVMRFVAEVVVTIIDAGSERDAVVENEALRAEILKELKSWDSSEWRKERTSR